MDLLPHAVKFRCKIVGLYDMTMVCTQCNNFRYEDSADASTDENFQRSIHICGDLGLVCDKDKI